MTIRNFQDANAALEHFIPRPYVVSKVYTLDRIKQLLEYLGNPQENFKTIHIAGTSGKTSTAYYCAALLTATGAKVGLTVSPHIDEINDRVQIDMIPLAEDEFCGELTEFLELVERSGVIATYYELMVAFAYWVFARRHVEYAVVEVGLGGLLDGTNVISRPDKVCVITDIGLDHTHILGNTLPEIATQKAGIIQPGNVAYMLRQADEIIAVVRERCRVQDAKLEVIDQHSEARDFLPLFQQRNFYLAQSVTSEVLLRDGHEALTHKQRQHAKHTYIPGRMEEFEYAGKTIVVDGAHNVQKMRTLMESMAERYPGKSFAAMAAFVKGEDIRWQREVKELAPRVSTLLLTSFATTQDTVKHSVDPATVARFCEEQGYTNVSVMVDSQAALSRLFKAPEDVLLVTGSFYLLHVVRPALAALRAVA